jgi:hypothetical protein
METVGGDKLKYQVVAIYDDHIVVMDRNAHQGDFSTLKKIKF